ncbi:hypothetical protein Xcab_04335 [Xenorhabdus cabanillasii JM26]|nr:hypothetical protein Xcab_04335 [Xenorhabdus cabanillasii JM26]
MTATFIFAQDVHFRFELSVWVDRTWLRQNLTTLNVITLSSTQQNTYVLTRTAFVQQFAEHFNASTSCFGGFFDTNDFNFVTHFNDTTLNTTSNDSTTAGDGEYVFDWQQEWLVNVTLGFWDVRIQCFSQLDDFRFPLCVAFQRFQSRTTDDWRVIAWEIVLRQQLTDFHFYQFQQLFVINHVTLVQEHDDVWYTYLTAQQDVLTSLWHWTISGSNNQDRAIHLSRTGDHVFHVVGVAWAVNVCIVTRWSIVFYVRSRDGDTTCFFFWCVIDLVECTSVTAVSFRQNGSDGSSQGSFTVVNVADSTNVNVRF